MSYPVKIAKKNVYILRAQNVVIGKTLLYNEKGTTLLQHRIYFIFKVGNNVFTV